MAFDITIHYRLRRSGVEGARSGVGPTIQQATAAIKQAVDKDNGYQGVDVYRVDIHKEYRDGVLLQDPIQDE